MPAVRTEHHQSRATEMDVAMEQGNAMSSSGFLHNGAANGYTNEHTNGTRMDTRMTCQWLRKRPFPEQRRKTE